MMASRMLRSWPWSLALAAVLAGFVLLGLIGVGLRTSAPELLISAVVTALSAAALVRALTTGVRLTPSGLIIRELTRSTPIPWSQVREVNCAKSAGRGYVPVLILTGPPPGRSRSGAGTAGSAATNGRARLEVTVLAAYREPVARRRADQLAAAFAATRTRRR
jgi:hypothetical protein